MNGHIIHDFALNEKTYDDIANFLNMQKDAFIIGDSSVVRKLLLHERHKIFQFRDAISAEKIIDLLLALLPLALEKDDPMAWLQKNYTQIPHCSKQWDVHAKKRFVVKDMKRIFDNLLNSNEFPSLHDNRAIIKFLYDMCFVKGNDRRNINIHALFIIMPITSFHLPQSLLSHIISLYPSCIITIAAGKHTNFAIKEHVFNACVEQFGYDEENYRMTEALSLLFSQNYYDGIAIQQHTQLLATKIKVSAVRSSFQEMSSILRIVKNTHHDSKLMVVVASVEEAMKMTQLLKCIDSHCRVSSVFTTLKRDFIRRFICIGQYLNQQEQNNIEQLYEVDVVMEVAHLIKQHIAFQHAHTLIEKLQLHLYITCFADTYTEEAQLLLNIFAAMSIKINNREYLEWMRLCLHYVYHKQDVDLQANVQVVLFEAIDHIMASSDLITIVQSQCLQLPFFSSEEDSISYKYIAQRKLHRLIALSRKAFIYFDQKSYGVWPIIDLLNFLMPNQEMHEESFKSIAASVLPNIVVPEKMLPQKLYVTSVSKLMHDPYLYYLEHVLRLRDLHQDNSDKTELLFGVVVHAVLKKAVYLDYTQQYDDYVKAFFSIYHDIILEDKCDVEFLKKFWNIRMLNVSAGLYEYENQYAVGRKLVLVEQKISVALVTSSGREIVVAAIADRIDVFENGAVHIIDYKTGILPKKHHIESGLNPQLNIEAFIVSVNGLNVEHGMSSISSIELFYIVANGKTKSFEIEEVELQLAETENGLKVLLENFFVGGSEFFIGADMVKYNITLKYKHFLRLSELDM